MLCGTRFISEKHSEFKGFSHFDHFSTSATSAKRSLNYAPEVNDEAIGKIMAIFYIPFVVTAIVYGYLGDRHNRKVILVITTILQSLGVLGCGYSTTIFQFYASKIIIGVTQSACITLAPTVISDIYSGASRTKMLGMFATSVAIGSGAGMMGMGGIAKVYGRQVAFSVFSAFTCAFGILYFLVVPNFERGGK